MVRNEELINHPDTLCLAFGRATKGISYTVPTYLADHLCDHGRCYLKGWNNNGGEFEKPPKLNDMRQKLTKEEIEKHYKDCVEKLRKLLDWKPDQNPTSPGKEPRVNPWHNNLDDVMF